MDTSDTIPKLSTVGELHSLKEKHASFLSIVFYSDASQRSKDALSILAEIKKQKPYVPVFAVNVISRRTLC